MPKRLKILFLEEKVKDLEMIQRLLKQEDINFTSQVSIDRPSYLLALQNFKPDVILANHSLPQFNSVEALEIMQDQRPGTAFLLVTDPVSEEFAVAVIKKGADDYILKAQLDRLPEAIQSALKHRLTKKEKKTNGHVATSTGKNSEEKYRDLIENTNDIICTHDLDGKILFVNKAAEKIIGATFNPQMNLRILDILSPDTKNKFYDYLDYIKKEGQAHGLMKVQTFTGEILIWEYNNRLITIGTDSPFIHGHARDITELKKSEQKYRTTLQRITEGFVALDKNLCCTYINEKAGEIFGCAPENLIAKNIWTEFPETVGQAFLKGCEKAMTEQLNVYFEEYYPSFDKWFENHIYPSPEGLSIYFSDISERKKFNTILSENNKFIESIVNASPHIIYIYDLVEMRNVYVNRGIDKILNYSEKEIKHLASGVLTALMHPDDFDNYVANIYPRYALLADRQQLVHDYRMRHKDGGWRMLRSNESIFSRQPDGSPKQIFGSCEDITNAQKVESQLAGEKKVLEMAALGKPLPEILETIVLNYESYSQDTLCSILLPDKEGTHLLLGAGPSMPPAYNKAIDGGSIGPAERSCGTAAYRKERVIVSDIANDPLWKDYRALALSHGLKSCWSTPIFSIHRVLIATFAVYYRTCREPDNEDLASIDWASNQVSIILEKHNSEQRIRMSEEKYRQLVEQASDGIFIANSNFQYIDANVMACAMLGYTKEELLKFTIKDLAYLEPGERPLRLNEMQDRKAIVQERKLRRNDGTLLDVEINATRMRDGNFLSFVRDISERKKVGRLIKESEEKYRNLIEQAADPIVSYQADGKLIDANESFYKISGYSRSQVPDLSISDLVFAEDLIGNPFNWKALKSGLTVINERRLKCRDGSAVDVELNSRMLPNGTFMLIGRDLTERKKTKKIIEDSEKKYRNLVEQASDGIIQINEWGQIILVNAALCHLLGYTNTEFMKLRIEDTYAETEKHLAQQRREQVIEKGLLSFERMLVRKDSTLVSVEITLSKIGEGQLLGMVRDITERKAAEEKIAKLNNDLELRVKERTAELEIANKELAEINDLFLGREARIIELKEALAELQKKQNP